MRKSSVGRANVAENTAKEYGRGIALESASGSLSRREASVHAATSPVDKPGDVSVTTPVESGNKHLSFGDCWAQRERSQFATESPGIGGVFSGTIGVIAAVVVAAGI